MSAGDAAGVREKFAAVMVAAFIGSENVAVTATPPPATPEVLVAANWLPFVGFDWVTVGIAGVGDAQVPPGGTGTGTGTGASVTFAPKMGPLPSPPPPQPRSVAVMTARAPMLWFFNLYESDMWSLGGDLLGWLA